MSQSPGEWTVLSMLEWATEYFKEKKINNPRHSIEWLLAHVLNCKRLDLYLKYDRPLSEHELSELKPLVKRRALHEPLQYITGSTDFINCRIEVNPGVLIPRIETEQLVEEVLSRIRKYKTSPGCLLDIGTGSGCIPIAIKKSIPDWNCFGCDISDTALITAKKNAEANNTEVTFFNCDLFDQSSGLAQSNWDVIISNPPYIQLDEKSSVEKQVSEFEPGLALFHKEPLDVYRSLTDYAIKNLKSGGLLFLEINAKLAGGITEIVDSQSFNNFKLKKDLDGNPRFIIAEK